MAFWKKEVVEDLEEIDYVEIIRRDRAAKRALELQAEEDAKSPEQKRAEEEKREEERRLAEDRMMAERARRLVEKAKRAEAEKLAREQKIEEEQKKEQEVRLEEIKMREEAARRAEEERIAEEARIHEEAMRRAEEARRAEVARIAEETRKAEEARRIEMEQERIRQEAEKIAQERIHQEALRLVEERRQAEERRLEEERRQAEEHRLEEERRQAEEHRLEEERRQAEEHRLEEEARQANEIKNVEETIVMKNREMEEILVLEVPSKEMKDPHFFLGRQDKIYALGWHMENGEVDAFFYSRSNEIRALEFMEFLVMEYGKASGNSTYAQAKLPEVLFKVIGREISKEGVEAFLYDKVREYNTECEWLYTEGMINDGFLKDMPRYKKKYIPWAYVKTTDILPRGERFRMKMLENESEVEVVTDDSIYIMIGIKGEIYNITADKFETTYRQTFELFDIYDIMPMYLPTVYSCVTNKRISLGDKAHLCYPLNKNMIYAKQLERKSKVFTKYNKGEYFVGKPGDYLVVRTDDLNDVYVIQKEIFNESYEKAIDV